MTWFEKCSWPRKTGSAYKYHMKLRECFFLVITAFDLVSLVISKSPKIQFLQPIDRTGYFRNILKEVIFTYSTCLPFFKKNPKFVHTILIAHEFMWNAVNLRFHSSSFSCSSFPQSVPSKKATSSMASVGSLDNVFWIPIVWAPI